MILRPSISTLFPYTTLFRSCLSSKTVLRSELSDAAFSLAPGQHSGVIDLDTACYILFVEDKQDRKSTRLNSSHRCISYAVYCLKKKKSVESARAYIRAKGAW